MKYYRFHKFLTLDNTHNLCVLCLGQEMVDVIEEGEDSFCTEPSHPACPAYGELLDVMTCTTTRFDPVWGGVRNRKLFV